jgi:hypothetical protein
MLPMENTELIDSLPESSQHLERKLSLHEFIAAEEIMSAFQRESHRQPDIPPERLRA